MSTASQSDAIQPLKDRRVTFVGKLGGLTRREAQQLVRRHGGVPVEKLNASVELVVIGADELPLGEPEELLDEASRQAAAEGRWEIITETQQTTQKTLQENIAVGLASSLSESDAEANAILANWRNRVFPEHMPLQEQMEEMHAAVNRKKLLSKNSEIARALRSRDNVSEDTAGTHRDAPKVSEPRISAADAKVLTGEAGFLWDGAERKWKKKLPKGQFLVKDNMKSKAYIA